MKSLSSWKEMWKLQKNSAGTTCCTLKYIFSLIDSTLNIDGSKNFSAPSHERHLIPGIGHSLAPRPGHTNGNLFYQQMAVLFNGTNMSGVLWEQFVYLHFPALFFFEDGIQF